MTATLVEPTTSATDELRRLLDERGVEHYDGYDFTEWDVDSIHYLANDHLRLGGRVVLRRTCTPEQAIEVTLGRGTCHIEAHFGEWYCTSCGDMVGTCDPDSELCVDGNYVEMWHYCPNCGKKVER